MRYGSSNTMEKNAKHDLLEQDSYLETSNKWQQPKLPYELNPDKPPVKQPKKNKLQKTNYDMLSSWSSKRKTEILKSNKKSPDNTQNKKLSNKNDSISLLKSGFPNRSQIYQENNTLKRLDETDPIDWIKFNKQNFFKKTKEEAHMKQVDYNGKDIMKMTSPFRNKLERLVLPRTERTHCINLNPAGYLMNFSKEGKPRNNNSLNFLKKCQDSKIIRDSSYRSIGDKNYDIAKKNVCGISLVHKKRGSHLDSNSKKQISKSQNSFYKHENIDHANYSKSNNHANSNFILSKENVSYLFSLKDNRMIGPINNMARINSEPNSTLERINLEQYENLITFLGKDENGQLKKFSINKNEILKKENTQDARQVNPNFSEHVELMQRNQSYSKLLTNNQILKSKSDLLKRKRIENTLKDMTARGIDCDDDSWYHKKIPKQINDYQKKDAEKPFPYPANYQSSAVRLKSAVKTDNIKSGSIEVLKANKQMPYSFKINLKNKVAECCKNERVFLEKMKYPSIERRWFEMFPNMHEGGSSTRRDRSFNIVDSSYNLINTENAMNLLDSDRQTEDNVKVSKILNESFSRLESASDANLKLNIPAMNESLQRNYQMKASKTVKKKKAISEIGKILELFKNLPRGKQFVDNRNILMNVQKTIKQGDNLYNEFIKQISSKDKEIIQKLKEEKKKMGLMEDDAKHDNEQIPVSQNFLDKKGQKESYYKVLTTRCESGGMSKEAKGHLKFESNDALSAIKKRLESSGRLAVDRIRKIDTIEKKIVETVEKKVVGEYNHQYIEDIDNSELLYSAKHHKVIVTNALEYL